MSVSTTPSASDTAGLLGCIYTLTPTHCGTGQTTGAVDLPIARESHTRLPILPSTMLKGVARQLFDQQHSDLVKTLFGPKTDAPDLVAGSLIFTEGHLLALPVRSLNQPYLYVTCPLILERLDRDLRAIGMTGIFESGGLPQPDENQVQVADSTLADQTLVLEDLIYKPSEVRSLPQLAEFAQRVAALLPDNETASRDRVVRDLVVVPDNDLLDLAERTVPVQARIQLGPGKTTSTFLDDDGEKKSGNLWYEETVPPDSIFTFFILPRRNTHSAAAGHGDSSNAGRFSEFRERLADSRYIQIGGNQTVGQGCCWLTISQWND